MSRRSSGESDALAVLRRAFPPPLAAGVPAADWDAVEAELGLRLPTSYKRLCDLYADSPIGEWGSHVDLIAPQARSKRNSFPAAALTHNAGLRRRRASDTDDTIPDFRGWRFHPEEDGLLPWAWNGSQAVFFEVDRAVDPDEWRIVEPRGYRGDLRTADLSEVSETDAAAFLVRFLDAEPKAIPAEGVERSWARIERVLASDHPKALDALRPGASERAIAKAERKLGFELPEPFRESLRRHDGQDPDGPWLVDGGLLNHLKLLLYAWREMTKSQDAGDHDGFDLDVTPDPGVRGDQWWRRGWLAFASRDGGEYLVLDLDPAPLGLRGQVFVFGRLTGAGRIVAPDFATWLAIWARDLEGGVARPVESSLTDDDEEDEYDPPPCRTWPS